MAERHPDDALLSLLYDELPPPDAEALRARLAREDPESLERLQQWQAIRAAVAELPEVEPDPQMHYDLVREARKAVAPEEKPSRLMAWLQQLTLAPALAGLLLMVLAAGLTARLTRDMETVDDEALAPTPTMTAAPGAGREAAKVAQPKGEAEVLELAEPVPVDAPADDDPATVKGVEAAFGDAEADEAKAAEGAAQAPVIEAKSKAPAPARRADEKADGARAAKPAPAKKRASKRAPPAEPRGGAVDDLFDMPPPGLDTASTRDRRAGADPAPPPPRPSRAPAKAPAPAPTLGSEMDDKGFAPPPPPAEAEAEDEAVEAVEAVEASAEKAAAEAQTVGGRPEGVAQADADAPARAEARERRPAAPVTPTPDDAPADDALAAERGEDDRLERARLFRQRGLHREAVDLYESFLADHRGDGLDRVWFETAQSYEALGQADRALRLYRLVANGESAYAGRARARVAALSPPPRGKAGPQAAPRSKATPQAAPPIDFEEAAAEPASEGE